LTVISKQKRSHSNFPVRLRSISVYEVSLIAVWCNSPTEYPIIKWTVAKE